MFENEERNLLLKQKVFSSLLFNLNESCILDCIEILDLKKEIFEEKKVVLEFSADGKNWEEFIFEYFEYDGCKCTIYIPKIIPFQYVRITFKQELSVTPKINFTSARSKTCIVSSKPDGFGMRLASMLIGMYLAEKLHYKFVFLWPNSIDIDAQFGIRKSHKDEKVNYLGNAMEDVRSIFSETFLAKYLLNDNTEAQYSHGNKIRSIRNGFDDIKNDKSEEIWGWYSTDILPSKWIKECKKQECLSRIRDLYRHISFSPIYENILKDADLKSLEVKNFVALHIRGGDIIFSPIRKVPGWGVIKERYFPYEIAMEIVLEELEANNEIIIFGQDLNANEALVSFVKNKYHTNKVRSIDSFIDAKYDDMQRSFFEINFMSKAEKIYSAQESVFSKVAMMISGKDTLISYHDIFSLKQQYDIMQKNIFTLNLHPLQTAMSYFKIYSLARNLAMSLDLCIDILNKALKLDDDNDAYRIYILDCLFEQNKYMQIENMLKDILTYRYESFLATLLYNSCGSFILEYEKYLKFKDLKYPYIFYVRIMITSFRCRGNMGQALALCNELSELYPKIGLFENFIYRESKISAVSLVKSQLSYKIGQTLIQSKSLKKIINLPYSIFRAVQEYKKEREIYRKIFKNKCTPLCHYEDYEQSLKIKTYLSYKVGNAIIKANKNWYRGGYFVLPFKLIKIYKKHKRG